MNTIGMQNGQGRLEILVVEDNDDDVFIIRRLLDEAPEVTVVARVCDGQAALDYMRKQGSYGKARAPHLVLLDINLHGKSGFEVLEEMRADPTLRTIPVVVLSTSNRAEDVQRAYLAGANTYLVKSGDLARFSTDLRQFATFWGSVARLPDGPPSVP